MAYTFDSIFAADPSNAANVASNAAITIFDPNDPGKAPITITDPTDSPISNPITVNKNGFGPAFKHATLDRVGWSGGGFEGFFTSYEGIKNVAVAAQAAAEAAEADTAVAVGAVVTTAAVNESGKLILTKADASTVDAGSVIGPTGPKGDKGLDGSNVLPTDDAIEQAIKTAGTKTQVALSATYVQHLSSTSGDQTARINAALTAAAGGTLKLRGAFTTSTPLLIPSDTTLDASESVITQTNNSNVNFVRNKNAGTGTRDKNVTIVGGTWNKGTNGGTGNDNHAFFLRGVDGLTIRDIKVTSQSGKYAIALGDVTKFHVENAQFDTYSDGIHVTGPARSGFIGSVHGKTGDDMVAFTARDWASYDDVRGDITDVTVDGVYPNASLCGVKMIAGTGTKVRRVAIRNVRGTTQLDGVRLFDDQTGASDLDGILVDGVDVQPGAGYSVVQITASLLKNLTLRNLRTDGTGYTTATLMTYGNSYLGAATAKSILIDGATITGNPGTAMVSYINGNDTIDSLSIANISVPDNPTSMSAVKLQPGNAWVKRIHLSNVNVVRSGGNLVEGVTAGARFDFLTVNGGYVSGGGGAFQTTSHTNPLVVTISNIVLNGSLVGTALCPTTVTLNSVSTTGSVAVVRLQTANATPCRVTGAGLSVPDATHGITRDGTQAVSVNHPDMRIDANILTPKDGDVIYNRNVNLSCGLGRVVSNGTSWKNLYTDAIYP